MTRYYSSTAQPTTLSAACTDVATTIQVTATTGFPAVEYIIAVDYGTSQQELMKVTAAAGGTLTVVRGFDSTTAQSHSLGAAVRHVHAADDFRLSRTHEAASSGVHGVTGGLVGTTDTQALSNKDLTAGTNTFPSSLATDAEVTTAVNNHAAVTATHGATGAVVGTTNTQTLTNKSIDLGTNTVTMTKAQLNTAVSDADVATLAGTETLTGKTLTSPTVTGLTLDGVNISGAWTAYTPTAANFTVGNGTLTGRYIEIGKTIIVRITFVAGTTTTYTGTQFTINLPVATHATGIQVLPLRLYSPAGQFIASATIGAGASVASLEVQTSTANCGLVGMASTSPNPGTTGSLIIEGTYEAA